MIISFCFHSRRVRIEIDGVKRMVRPHLLCFCWKAPSQWQKAPEYERIILKG
jgi:hypothetical protein